MISILDAIFVDRSMKLQPSIDLGVKQAFWRLALNRRVQEVKVLSEKMSSSFLAC